MKSDESTYYTIDYGPRSKKAWIKVGPDGKLEDQSNAFTWACFKPFSEVEEWCKEKGLTITKLPAGVKNIRYYL